MKDSKAFHVLLYSQGLGTREHDFAQHSKMSGLNPRVRRRRRPRRRHAGAERPERADRRRPRPSAPQVGDGRLPHVLLHRWGVPGLGGGRKGAPRGRRRGSRGTRRFPLPTRAQDGGNKG